MVPTHVHSEYSALDGLSTVEEIADRCVQIGCPCCAISDHGTIAGHLAFDKAMRSKGIKPILAAELYHGVKTEFGKNERDSAHLIVGALTSPGLLNLWRLVDDSAENFRYVSRVNWKMLEKYHEGLYATSSCALGLVPKEILNGDYEALNRYLEIFRDDYYIELHTYPGDSVFGDNGDEFPITQKRINLALVEIAKERGIPVIYADDAHFANPNQYELHDAYLAMQMGQTIYTPIEERRMWHPKTLYIKDEAQIREDLAYLPKDVVDEAIRNSEDLGKRCSAELPGVTRHLPKFVPKFSEWIEPALYEMSAAEIFINEVEKGIYLRYGPEPDDEVWNRALREMNIFIEAGLEHYFLLAWDLVQYCKINDIEVGCGRGCLDGNVPIWTTKGFIPISKIQVGDEICTHTGEVASVTHRWEYECNEPLITIQSYYGDNVGVTLTRDHKVWAEKGVQRDQYIRCIGSRSSLKKWENPKRQFTWISAGDVEPGDLVVVPKAKKEEKDVDIIDLSLLISDFTYISIQENILVELVPTNRSYKSSLHDLSKRYELDRQSTLGRAYQGVAGQRVLDKLLPILIQEGFTSVQEWREYIKINSFTKRIIPRYIPIDDEFCKFLGRFVSDGWLVTKTKNFGIAEQNSLDNGDIPELFSVWGIIPSKTIHATKDLVQYTACSHIVWQTLKALMPEYQHNPQTKHLPDWCLTLPDSKKWSLLEGLWLGDGSIGTACGEKTSYDTVSPKLSYQVRDLLWSMGIHNGVSLTKRNDIRKGFSNTQPAYKITTSQKWIDPPTKFGGSSDDYIYMRVRSVRENDPILQKVYDLEVNHPDHSFLTSSFAVHNSSAGCLVAYCLEITDVCPLHYNLIFERFWNAGRADGFPDIDMDFPRAERRNILHYLEQRWGSDHVRLIGSTSRLKPKSLVDKTYKAFSITPVEASELKRIFDNIPDLEIHGPDQIGWNPDLEPGKTIYVQTHIGEEIEDWVKSKPKDRQEKLNTWLIFCEHLCSRVSGYGIHASGIVITDKESPINTEAPSRWHKDEKLRITMAPMDEIEQRQLIKMDCLGLRTLDTLADWKQQMKSKGVDIDWSGMERDQYPVEMWELFDDKKTLGLFQIEDKPAVRKLVSSFKPRSIEDLSIIVALNRPGPLRAAAGEDESTAEMFVKRKNGEQDVTYPHEFLEDILKETYGLFLYQEQVIAFFNKMNYSLSDSDAIRKILGKKKPEALTAIKSGTGEWEGKGFDDIAPQYVGKAAEQIWSIVRGFADYSFNKSHSVAYGTICWRTVFAKYFGSAEYAMACIRTDPKRAGAHIAEARRMGHDVLGPDIWLSHSDVTTDDDGCIRFGFQDIKGIKGISAEYVVYLREEYGQSICTREGLEKALITEQDEWSKESKLARKEQRIFEDKSPKQSLRKNQIDALQMAGAFDNFEDRMVTITQKQELEMEFLGVAVTDLSPQIFANNHEKLENVDSYLELNDLWTEDIRYTIPGVISYIKKTVTRKDKSPMGIVTIGYDGDEVEFAVFPQQWKAYKFLFVERNVGIFTLKRTARGLHFDEGQRLT